jgi:hypothetical protein
VNFTLTPLVSRCSFLLFERFAPDLRHGRSPHLICDTHSRRPETQMHIDAHIWSKRPLSARPLLSNEEKEKIVKMLGPRTSVVIARPATS